jgi:hypothetical protein
MSSMALRRITKEISNINDKDYIEHSTYSKEFKTFLTSLTLTLHSHHSQGDQSNNFLIIKDHAKLFLELSIPQSYPFKSFKVLNYDKNVGLNYYNYINNVSSKINNYDKNIYKFFYKCLYNWEPYFLNLKKNDCYCCSSVMCPNLWCPAYTFVNVILEHLEISFIERYSSFISYKYLTTIYKGLLNKLPLEIVEHIVGSL